MFSPQSHPPSPRFEFLTESEFYNWLSEILIGFLKGRGRWCSWVGIRCHSCLMIKHAVKALLRKGGFVQEMAQLEAGAPK